MVYLMKCMVSSKPWKPIFNVRTRPPLVQMITFEFLKELKWLRYDNPTLPNINCVSLPSDRQFVVSFGELIALCDCIEYIIDNYGRVHARYGGPDERGTLWIEFYKNFPSVKFPSEQLVFVIWIKSLIGPSIAFDDVKTFKQQTANPTRALEASQRGYQPIMLTETPRRAVIRRRAKKRTEQEKIKEKLKRGAKRH